VPEAGLSDAWEAKADEWSVWARTPRHDHFFVRLNWPAFARMLPAPSGRTLDVGCGEGRCGRELAATGHRVTGLDSSVTLAELARGGGGYEEVVCASATQMPFPDGEFSLAVAFMSLMDMDDPAAAIGEIARALEPGGYLCLAIVHPINRPESALGDYFAEHRVAEEVERDGKRMIFEAAHRPLGSYAAALADAGFIIEQLTEPQATPGDEDDQLAAAARRPFFMHLRCRLQA
jgi:SAM-dependent methyltransferase